MPSTGTEQRKLAAIMFTDMVGYSALAQRNEALALDLLDEHRRALRGLFPKHQGMEIKTTGDGFLVEFASALAAVRCAVEIQRALAERNQAQPVERQVRIRIGIHLGDVMMSEGDIHGDGVNIAARVEPLAEPGGICISRAVFEQVQGKLAEAMESAGEVELKNLARPVEVFRVEPGGGRGNEAQTSSTHEGQSLLTSAATAQKSLAVLPFVNMSDDRENEFLADGITDDLITALSRVKGLRVPARTSSFAFKGRNEDIRRIGQLLNVETVLEGSVRKSGNKLRVTAQLVKVRDGFHLWSERYDREMKDVFDIQDDITRAIVGAPEVQLAAGAETQFVRRQTGSTEAYELYVKGRIFWNQRGVGPKKALHYFELALLEDPNYAPAWSGLADGYNLLALYDVLPGRDALAKAKAAAQKAVALDDRSAEAHCSLGWVLGIGDWNLPAAERECLRAIELNPNYTLVRHWYAVNLWWQGRNAEVIAAQEQRGVEGDPLSFYAHANLGWMHLALRQFDAALPPLRRCQELNPNFLIGRWLLGCVARFTGQREMALAELQRAVDMSGRMPIMLASLGAALAEFGETSRAREIQRELTARTEPAPTRPWLLAQLHAAFGEKDLAFAALEQALVGRDLWLPAICSAGPELLALESDPRYSEFVAKVQAAVRASSTANP